MLLPLIKALSVHCTVLTQTAELQTPLDKSRTSAVTVGRILCRPQPMLWFLVIRPRFLLPYLCYFYVTI